MVSRAKNMVWLLVSQFATWIVSLVVLIIVPDELGADDFGTISFAQGYVAFFSLAAGLGLSTFLAKAVARDRSVTGLYVGNAVAMTVATVAVATAVALAVAFALGNRGQTLLLVAIFCGGMLLQLVYNVLSGALNGMEVIAAPARWLTLQVYLQSVVSLGVLWLDWGLVPFAVVIASSHTVSLVACSVMLWPHVRGRLHLDPAVWRLLARGGVPLLALTALNVFYGTIDIPILHRLTGGVEVGWYTVAYRWIGIPVFISTAVVYTYFPALSAHGVEAGADFARLVNRSLKLVALVTLPAAVGTVLVADDLIHAFYGPDYDRSVVLVRILALHVPFAAFDTILATSLVAADRLRRYFVVAAGAAVLNPIACVIAIRLCERAYDNGAIGAAIVTCGTEVFILSGALVLRVRGVLDRATTFACARMGAAASAMVPVLLTVRDAPLPVQVAIGVLAYVVASIAIGTVAVSDLRSVAGRVTDSLGRRRAPIVDTGALVRESVEVGSLDMEPD